MGAALDAVVNVWMRQDAGDYQGALEWFQPDAVVTSRGVQLPRGVQEMVEYWQATRTAFPDLRRDVLETVEDADSVALRIRVDGTNTGPLTGAGGQVPATGRPCRWEGIDMIHLRDGKIATWHGMYDQLGMLTQLGLVGG